ncbi:MAG: type 4a pilus biogenesis protein PilO, partial [Desulfofustis sp.]|nr:type 4a pilus biogenesis protein PilO [Desulfofustis sp.]
FLEQKYIPLEKKYKMLLGAVLIIAPIALFYFLFFQPKSEEIKGLEGTRDKLVKEIQDLREKKRRLPILLAQVQKVQDEFEEAAKMLPKTKEIPKLLTDMSALGRNAGLDFVSFTPKGEVQRDFYNEVPVAISIKGPYHSIGGFLDQVSKLDRIVSVTNISAGSPKKSDLGEWIISASGQLVTYRFTNQPLPKPDDKK